MRTQRPPSPRSTPTLTPPGIIATRDASSSIAKEPISSSRDSDQTTPLYFASKGIGSAKRGVNVTVRHVVEVGQFDRPEVERLFEQTDRMRELRRTAAPLAGRILATIFY